MGQEVRTGMEFHILRPYLPASWLSALEDLPPAQRRAVQEIRLRAGRPVTVSAVTGEWYLSLAGLTALRQPGVFLCDRGTLEDCFLRFCQESVYAHQEELRQGFLTAPGGIRVGVAGTAVTRQGTVNAVTQVTSLCIRLPRRHVGCAAAILPLVLTPVGPVSSLLVGEPSSGKTSLLRDLSRGMAARGVRVTVVDERGEIAGPDGLAGCDVLRDCPKAVGIRQAVRCLAPQVVVFDELGEEAEIRAVAACAHAGVAVVASLHGRHPAELGKKPVVRELVSQGVFERWLFLTGHRTPGVVYGCYEPEVTEDALAWRAVGGVGRDGARRVLCPSPVPTG